MTVSKTGLLSCLLAASLLLAGGEALGSYSGDDECDTGLDNFARYYGGEGGTEDAWEADDGNCLVVATTMGTTVAATAMERCAQGPGFVAFCQGGGADSITIKCTANYGIQSQPIQFEDDENWVQAGRFVEFCQSLINMVTGLNNTLDVCEANLAACNAIPKVTDNSPRDGYDDDSYLVGYLNGVFDGARQVGNNFGDQIDQCNQSRETLRSTVCQQATSSPDWGDLLCNNAMMTLRTAANCTSNGVLEPSNVNPTGGTAQ